MVLVILFLILFGLAIGSFLNVVIYRTVHAESFVYGRSHCPKCKHQIAWYDNIPLISYVMLWGKCRHCKQPISWMYPAIEFITAALFVWWYAVGFAFFQLVERPFSVLQPLFWLVVGVLLIIIFFSDLLYGIIPDGAIFLLGSLGVVYRGMLFAYGIMQPTDFWWTLGGACASLLLFFGLWAGTRGKGMGFGDVKFAFPMGLLVGWPWILVALFISFVSGAAVGVGLVVLKKRTLMGKTGRIPFGPFLVFGTVVALVWGEAIVQWYIGML